MQRTFRTDAPRNFTPGAKEAAPYKDTPEYQAYLASFPNDDEEQDREQARKDFEASRAQGSYTPHLANDGRDVVGNASDAFANRMANLWRGDKADEPKPAPKDEDEDDDGDDIYAAQRKMAKKNADKWKQPINK